MLLIVLLLLISIPVSFQFDSGFWYGGTRPPVLKYDSVPYANLTVRVDRSYFEGPGQNLVHDPLIGQKSDLYTGVTINRQTFDTQFILDMEMALGLDRDRIFVMFVSPGKVHFSWETRNVIVNFIFLERNHSHGNITLLEAVSSLTNQIQDKSSLLYSGNVTKDIDSYWGLEEVNWDLSLKLTYAIEVIGGDSVIDGYYLNQGGLGLCDTAESLNHSMYCEFERFFEDDISRALEISSYRVNILFIKKAALDAVLIHFRIVPAMRNSGEINVTMAQAHLLIQVHNLNSELYKGNVTIRVDPLWGVSEQYGVPRTQESLFTTKWYEYDPSRLLSETRSRRITAYDRCKANRRCNWGILDLNQVKNEPVYYHRLFDDGELFPIDLFLDFEDWRTGTRGFSFAGTPPPTMKSRTHIRGAHFDPFNTTALGPDIPCYEIERNQGLVLDRQLQANQIGWQESLVDDLTGRVDWLGDNIEWATMNAIYRSRKDVKIHLRGVQATYNRWRINEINELNVLNSSQCSMTKCTITFNTTSLELTGAIEGRGDLRFTPSGTEVAVFAFNSIYLGPETEVILCGQRALSLVSRTVAIINTTFFAIPGTLGGFPGGYSVARSLNDALTDHPRDVLICELGQYCDEALYNLTVAQKKESLVTNNVNGPGSGNLRIHPFVIETSAFESREIQMIRTDAQPGQTLSGGFVLHFHSYSTPLIPHDISASSLKTIIEQNLNMITLNDGAVRTSRGEKSSRRAGVGIVEVTRSFQTNQEGYTWNITFTTAVGNIDQLTVTSYLQALNSSVYTDTIRDGNEILGDFTLSFMGYTTDKISSYETAAGFKSKLLGIPVVRTAFVNRIDPTQNCDDGLCPNGPRNARGMSWTIYITTDAYDDNYTPFSPTSSAAMIEGQIWDLVADTSSLIGVGATVTITRGTAKSPEDLMSILNVSRPFSLAFGGGGGSYGGRGGPGYSENPVGRRYNDKFLGDLLGGSGGCMRSPHPFEINAVRDLPTGRGGHGGGAIEFIAPNDIVIGSFGKIIAQGGDGEQTGEGGGGGGSGGSILLSAGGVVVLEGLLDTSGGDGGFGGPGRRSYLTEEIIDQIKPGSLDFSTLDSMAGGGGGGGRIAIYGESIVSLGDDLIRNEGGKCGILKTNRNVSVVNVNISIVMALKIPLNNDRVVFLGATYINHTLPTLFVDAHHLSKDVRGSITYVEVNYMAVLDASWNASSVDDRFNSTIGFMIGQVLMVDYNLKRTKQTFRSFIVESSTLCENHGESGSIFQSATMTSTMIVKATSGAESTLKALFLSNREETKTLSGSVREAPFAQNGPTIPFDACKPTRVTYYTRLDSVQGESQKSSFGTLFSLLSDGTPIIGVYVGDKIMHGVNFVVNVDESYFLKRFVTIDEYPFFDVWYKVDIHIDWDDHTYYILLNDVVVAIDQKFKAESLDGIRLSINRAANVWFDEIYVGFDNTMGFQCPVVTRRSVETGTPDQYGWSLDELYESDEGKRVDGTILQPMQRHYNHLDPTGSVAFDGQGKITLFQDIKFKFASGDYDAKAGKLHAGAMFYVTNSLRSAKTASGRSATLVSPSGLWYQAKPGIDGAGDGRQFTYAEHEYIYSNSRLSSLNGGVAACSSNEMLNWRFEGIVFHYTNISDLVFGFDGPFTMTRPRVLFNPHTKLYVMWAVFDDINRTLAMNAVASSPYEDGPFLLRRSFYPDGNKTRDQVIYEASATQVVLGRTYYATIEYVMPEAMMQPSWESAKNRQGQIDYRLSYQRSQYQIGYDNFHDIYAQRWRKEDKEYSVFCVNKKTGERRSVPSGVVNSEGAVCTDPDEKKVIEGQGNPTIQTKFVSLLNKENSWWIQTSVPAVKAQPWKNNYRDGYCGVRNVSENMEFDDPNLDYFKPSDRGTCSNIADNPVHPALQDKLIGVQRVVFRRRSKFIALSALTQDYMDTSGFLNVYEGEFDSGNLVSIISEMGQFMFKVDDTFTNKTKFRSTFQAPVRSEFETAVDYSFRFRQYMQNYNDRASYALACAIDGICPVNFLKQILSDQK